MIYLTFLVSLILFVQGSGGSTGQAAAAQTTPIPARTTTTTTAKPTTAAETTMQREERFIVGSVPIISNIVYVNLHDNVTLYCDVTGNPTPTVNWNYDKTQIFNAKLEGTNLFLGHVTIENEGVYECHAQNEHGSATLTTKVSVRSPVEVKLKSPVVVIDLMDFPAGVVRVNCKATGDPKPTVTWSKYNGAPIVNDANHLVFGDGDMIIKGVEPANFVKFPGIYTCKGDNKVSSAVAYQIIAAKEHFWLDESITFGRFSVDPCDAFQALCAAGTTEPDGSPISKEFEKTDKVCVAARQVGAIGKEAGNVTWIIKPNGHPEIVDEEKGRIDLV